MTQHIPPTASDTVSPVLLFSRLDASVLLGDASQAMAMVHAGADRLVDLRSETAPPRLDAVIDHYPLTDLQANQDDLILDAARHIFELASSGCHVGVYCAAGVSRTSAVAITYMMLHGLRLSVAANKVRRARPQALPAMSLWHSLERLEPRLR